MKYVVDASVIAALLMPDEPSDAFSSAAGLLFQEGATCPGLMQLEFTNILLKSERRKRISADQVRDLSAAFDQIPLVLQNTLTHEQRHVVLNLARQHHLTSYDAAYLELTIRLNLKLVSLDRDLVKAAEKEGAGVYSF